MKILIVDDSKAMRMFGKAFHELEDYQQYKVQQQLNA